MDDGSGPDTSGDDSPARIDGGAGRAARILREQLRAGTVPADDDFDRLLNAPLRAASTVYWTPAAVAMRAALWLEDSGARSVLDVGSGAGKFCVIAASATSLRVVGLEQRQRLVRAARVLARDFEISSRVEFLEGALGEVALPEADAYYFFNPFAENVFDRRDRLDDDVELTRQRFVADLVATLRFLRSAPLGTLVVTYNGIGAPLPSDYTLRRIDRRLPCLLKLYEKTRIVARRPEDEWDTSWRPSFPL